jgi:hypothetical protein
MMPVWSAEAPRTSTAMIGNAIRVTWEPSVLTV